MLNECILSGRQNRSYFTYIKLIMCLKPHFNQPHYVLVKERAVIPWIQLYLILKPILFDFYFFLNSIYLYFFLIKIQYILGAEKLDKTKELTRETETDTYNPPFYDTTVNTAGYFISSFYSIYEYIHNHFLSSINNFATQF